MRVVVAGLLLLTFVGCAGMNERRSELVRINYQLGVGYFRQGDYAMAVEKLRRAESIQPERVDVLMMLGLAYHAMGRLEEAERAYREALDVLDQEEPPPEAVALAGELHNNYGVLLCSQGRVEAAEAQFRAALRDPGYRTPAAAWENLGLCALRAGREDQARKALQRALVLEPQRQTALSTLARLAWERGDASTARRYLRRIRAQGPLNEDDLRLAIRVERSLGDEAAARDLEAELIERYPNAPEVERLRSREKESMP